MANGKVTYSWKAATANVYGKTITSYRTIQPRGRGNYLALPMTQSGTYPTKYKITNVTLSVPVQLNVGGRNTKTDTFYLYRNSKETATSATKTGKLSTAYSKSIGAVKATYADIQAMYSTGYRKTSNTAMTSIGEFTVTLAGTLTFELKTDLDFDGLTTLYIASKTYTYGILSSAGVTLTVEYQDTTTPVIVVQIGRAHV